MATGIPFHRVTGGVNSEAFINNQIRVIAQPYLTSIIEGDIPDHTAFTLDGYSPVINTAEQVLWGVAPATQIVYVYPAAATTVDIVSTDADDNASGTGAREVTVTGLLAGYVEDTEVIATHATDGTIAVTTTKEWLRINSVEVTDAGASGKNEGDMTVLDGANILSFVEAGTNLSLQGVYTVPAGKSFFVENVRGAGAGGKNVHIHVYERKVGGLFRQIKHRTINNSPFEMTTFKFDEKTDIQVRCHADINGGIGDITFEGWVE